MHFSSGCFKKKYFKILHPAPTTQCCNNHRAAWTNKQPSALLWERWEQSLLGSENGHFMSILDFFFVIPQKCCRRLLHIIRENRNNYLFFRLLLEVFLTTTLRTMYLQTWNKTLQLSRLHDSSWSKISALPLWPLQQNHFSIMGLENWNNCFGKCEYQEKTYTHSDKLIHLNHHYYFYGE